MIKKIESIIERYSNEFDLIVENINNYLVMSRDTSQKDMNETWKTTIDAVNSLAKIAEACFAYGNFKDNWEYSNFYQNFSGPELIIKSLKTNCGYNLGLDNKGIYLRTYISHNDNIRYMGDDFWKSVLDLSEYKSFIYEENEFTRTDRTREFPQLFSANKSMIYRIMRKYIFDQTDPNFREGSSSVGELKIFLPFDTDVEEVIREFCTGFKIMHQLNYKLWKVSDLKKTN